MLPKPLSPFQRFYLFREGLKHSTTVAVTAVYSEPIFDPKNKQRLRDVVEQLIRTYELFRVNVFAEDGSLDLSDTKKYVFDEIDRLKFDSIVEYTQGMSISSKDFLLYIHSKDNVFKTFRKDLPLWKLYVLDNYTLCFCFDHLLFDGMSGINFHKIFLKTYVDSASFKTLSSNFQNVLFAKPLENALVPLCSAMDVIDHTPGWFHALKLVATNILFPKLPQYLQNWISPPTAVFSSTNGPLDAEPVYLTLNIPAEQLGRILKACKAKGISFTIWSIAALQLTLKYYFENKHIIGIVPVDLRKLLDPSNHRFGLYVAGQQFEFDPVSDNDPSVALHSSLENTQILRQLIENRFATPIMDVGTLSIISSFKNWFIDNLSKPKSVAIESSNLGFFTQDLNGLHVTDALFSNGNNLHGAIVSLYAISTQVGGANLVFVAQNKFSNLFPLIEKDFLNILNQITEHDVL